MTLSYRLLVVVAIFITVTPAAAIDPSPPGQLALEIFLSPSTAFMSEWTNTPSSYAPRIKRIRSVRIGQPAHAGFLVSGYSRRDDLTIDLVTDVRIIDPNGKAIFEQAGWSHDKKKVLVQPSFVLATNILDLMLEPGDPIGKYTIEASVHDQVSNKLAKASYVVEVLP